MRTFFGHSAQAIQEWFDAVQYGTTRSYPRAEDEGLVVRMGKDLYAFWGGREGYDDWMKAQIVLRTGLQLLTVEEPQLLVPEVEREFGSGVVIDVMPEPEAPVVAEPEAVTVEDEVPVQDSTSESVLAPKLESPTEASEPGPTQEPESETPVVPEPVLEAPRASQAPLLSIPARVDAYVGELPQAYEITRPVLASMVENGANDDALRYFLNQAIEAHNVMCLSKFCSMMETFLRALKNHNLDINTEYVKMINTALTKTCVQPGDEAQQVIYRKVLELAPDETKPRVKAFLDRLFETGDSKFLSEAWKQVAAAISEKRTSTPIRLLQSIIRDLAHEAELEANRAKPRLTQKDKEWVVNAPPRPWWVCAGKGENAPAFQERLARYETDADQWIKLGFIPWDEILGEWGMDTNYHCLMSGDLPRKYKDRRFGFVYTQQQYEDIVLEFLNTALDNIRKIDDLTNLSEQQKELVKSEVQPFMDHLCYVLDNSDGTYLDAVQDKLDKLYADGYRKMYMAQ